MPGLEYIIFIHAIQHISDHGAGLVPLEVGGLDDEQVSIEVGGWVAAVLVLLAFGDASIVILVGQECACQLQCLLFR